jgi:hypothetical protein
MKESRLIIRNKKKKTELEILTTKRACFGGGEREKERNMRCTNKKKMMMLPKTKQNGIFRCLQTPRAPPKKYRRLPHTYKCITSYYPFFLVLFI